MWHLAALLVDSAVGVAQQRDLPLSTPVQACTVKSQTCIFAAILNSFFFRLAKKIFKIFLLQRLSGYVVLRDVLMPVGSCPGMTRNKRRHQPSQKLRKRYVSKACSTERCGRSKMSASGQLQLYQKHVKV